jgi:prolyl-tRNA editing enzyme YbaK/EbsC (Cys-tRNA(Pro) deacylase)
MERAVTVTGMECGGITPIGLPADWPVLVDGRVTESSLLVIESRVCHSEIPLRSRPLACLPGASVLDGLGV